MGKNFNKILMLLTLILISLVSVNAVNLYDGVNNPENIVEYNALDVLEVNSYVNIVFYNSTYYLDDGKNYRLESKPLLFYVLYNNNNVAKDFNFIVLYKTNDMNQTQVLYHTIHLEGSQSTEIFVEPTSDYEWISTQIYCVDENSSTCGAGYQVKQFSMVRASIEETSIFTPLITGVVDLIVINVALWKLAFYVIIFAFVIGILVLLMWLVMKFYKWGKEHRVFKTRSNHR